MEGIRQSTAVTAATLFLIFQYIAVLTDQALAFAGAGRASEGFTKLRHGASLGDTAQERHSVSLQYTQRNVIEQPPYLSLGDTNGPVG